MGFEIFGAWSTGVNHLYLVAMAEHKRGSLPRHLPCHQAELHLHPAHTHDVIFFELDPGRQGKAVDRNLFDGGRQEVSG
jgi:hypothetical protein